MLSLIENGSMIALLEIPGTYLCISMFYPYIAKDIYLPDHIQVNCCCHFLMSRV